jgi:transposase
MISRLIEDSSHIYVACGATDFRKQMDGLALMVNSQFKLDPFSDQCTFVFCNRKRNAIKVLRYDGNGFILASKKLLNGMKFQWPKTPLEAREISSRQMMWLLQGLSIDQKKAHQMVPISAAESCY